MRLKVFEQAGEKAAVEAEKVASQGGKVAATVEKGAVVGAAGAGAGALATGAFGGSSDGGGGGDLLLERVGDGVKKVGGVGAGVLGLGVMGAEAEALIEFVRFIEKLIEDPKSVIGGWFGGAKEVGGAGAGVKDGGTVSNPFGVDKLEAKAHVPGEGKDVMREIPSAAKAKSPAEAYLDFAAAEKKAGRAVVPGTIVDLTFGAGNAKAHVNLEAIDGDKFRFADGQAGAAFVKPAGFDSLEYRRGREAFVGRGTPEGVVSASAEMGAGGRRPKAAGPAALGSLGLSPEGRKAMGGAAAALGGSGLMAGESGEMRKVGPPGVALASSAGAMSYLSFVGANGVAVGAGAAPASDGRTVAFAGRESGGVSRVGVVVGASGVELGKSGGVEVTGAAGRSFDAAVRFANPPRDAIVDAVKGRGAKLAVGAAVSDKTGAAVEMIDGGKWGAVVSEGKLSLFENSDKGPVVTKVIEDKRISIDRTTGAVTASPEATREVAALAAKDKSAAGGHMSLELVAALADRGASVAGSPGRAPANAVAEGVER